jgi:hypothetical protein
MESFIEKRQVRAIPGIFPTAVLSFECCDLIGIVSKPPRKSFIVDQLGLRAIYAAVSAVYQPVTVVDIVISYSELLFIESAKIEE